MAVVEPEATGAAPACRPQRSGGRRGPGFLVSARRRRRRRGRNPASAVAVVPGDPDRTAHPRGLWAARRQLAGTPWSAHKGASLRRWLRSASHMSAVRGRNGAELRRPGQPAPCGHPCLHRRGPVCQLLAVREASARGPVRAIPPAPADTSRSCRQDREPRRSRALTAGAATPSPCCRDTGRTGC